MEYPRSSSPSSQTDAGSSDQDDAPSHSNPGQHSRANMVATGIGLAQKVVGKVSNYNSGGSSNGPQSGPNYRHSLIGMILSTSEGDSHNEDEQPQPPAEANPKTRAFVWGSLTLLCGVALVVFQCFPDLVPVALYPWIGHLPGDPTLAALAVLDKAPIIDGHIDLPILVREFYANNVSAVELDADMPGHVDIKRLREGKVGGFFWSVYVGCPPARKGVDDFTSASWRVRDTLEQIDVATALIRKYPETFRFATSSSEILASIENGKVASLLGVEGGHQLGNSLAVLRQYHSLGVRYVTLTHTCHNAFADSCGFAKGITPLHNGLSDFGRVLVGEMNRLGVIIDLSHTSDDTAIQVLSISKSPVIWSHSSSRALWDVPRNVPDKVLRLIGTGEGQKDAVVMVTFVPDFTAGPGQADIDAVADHIEHIASVAGKKHVGIGSDFDGIANVPNGLEDVSKYPNLIKELLQRGWNKYELAGLTGANFLRVFKGVESVAQEIQASGAQPAYDLYEKRKDLPRKGNEIWEPLDDEL